MKKESLHSRIVSVEQVTDRERAAMGQGRAALTVAR